MLELEQVIMHVINTANKQLIISEKARDPYLAMIKKLMSR